MENLEEAEAVDQVASIEKEVDMKKVKILVLKRIPTVCQIKNKHTKKNSFLKNHLLNIVIMKDEIDHQIKAVQIQLIFQVKKEIKKEKVQEELLQIIMTTIIVLIIIIITDNIKMKEDQDDKHLQLEWDEEEVMIVI
jgi:hypothetical protein